MTQSRTVPPGPVQVYERHFRTDHLSADLKVRSLRGGVITVGAQLIKLGIQIGSTAVLARLLTPSDFGLVAMVSAVTGFVGLFRDMGLSMATVQRAQITHDQISVLFWINVAASGLLAVLCAACAPIIAWVYDEPRLVWIAIVISASFLFGGMAAQHTALLQRQMKFLSLMTVDILSLAVAALAAMGCAIAGARYWALVVMVVLQPIVAFVGVLISCRWWPSLPRRRTGVAPMLRFGGNLTGFSVLNYFTRNFDNVLIGYALGPGPLGIYSKAYNLLLLPIRQINSPIGAVALPALCRLRCDRARYRRYFLRAIQLVALCSMPIVAFAFVEAQDLVLCILGSQWQAAVPVFRWLAPAAFIGTMNVIPVWLCNSLDRTHRQLRWAAFAAPITVAGFAIGLRWGPSGVAAAFSITWCLLLVAFVVYSCIDSPIGVYEIWRTLRRPITASLGAALVTANAINFFGSTPYPFVRAFVAAVLYVLGFLLCYGIDGAGRRQLVELASTLRQLQRPL